MTGMREHDARAYADASTEHDAPAYATDGRTDGLTQKHSPNAESSPSVSRAGGQNESTPSQPVSDLSVPAPQPNPSAARVDLDLDQIEARAAHLDTDEYNQGVPANAPWRAAPSCSGPDRWIVYQPTGSDQTRIITEGLRQPFADFIAHAREDVPRLVAEVRRLRGVADAALAELDRSLEARDRRAEAERDAARAEADDLRRQLLDETYRPEGGEIVMRELGNVKRERDAAVAEAARVREALQAVREMHSACTECEGNGRRGWCHCCDAPWPCETRRALDAALDGAE